MNHCNIWKPEFFRPAAIRIFVILTCCSLCFLSPLFAYVFGFSFDAKLDQEYRKESVLIIDASVEVVKKEYLDADRFSIQDKKRISGDVFVADQDVFHGEVVTRVRYLVRFKEAKMIAGDAAEMEELHWSYENDATSMCPLFPRDLIQGSRYRFYVKRVNKQRAYDVNLLLIPAE